MQPSSSSNSQRIYVYGWNIACDQVGTVYTECVDYVEWEQRYICVFMACKIAFIFVS